MFDADAAAREHARNFSIECRRSFRESRELSERRPVRGRRQTAEDRVRDLMRQQREHHPEKIRALQREKPHLSEDAACYELVLRSDPELQVRLRREQLDLADVGTSPYPLTPRLVGQTNQEDLEIIRPDGVGKPLTPSTGEHDVTGRASGATRIDEGDGANAPVNASAELHRRVMAMISDGTAKDYADALGKVAAADPDLYQASQRGQTVAARAQMR